LWFHPIRTGAPTAGKHARRGRMLAGVKLALRDPGEAAAHVLRRLGRRRGDGRPPGYFMRVQLEQTPDADNPLRLRKRRDRNELPTVELALRLGECERQRHLETFQIAAEALGFDGRRLARQLGLRLDAGRSGFFSHHSGTTRMAADPASGVVDAD